MSDEDRFAEDLDSVDTLTTIMMEQKSCHEAGALSTPNTFINGDLITGAQPYERFLELIEEELEAT